MKRDKRFAAAWAVMGLLYLMIAAFNFKAGQLLFAVPTMLLGWGMCAVGCFYYGARYGINRSFDEVTGYLKDVEALANRMEAATAGMLREDQDEGSL